MQILTEYKTIHALKSINILNFHYITDKAKGLPWGNNCHGVLEI